MITRGLVTASLVAGLTVAIHCEVAHSTPLIEPMHRQDVTRISNDRGGYVVEYVARLHKLRQAGTQVQFTGRCLSACTIYLALPRDQICVSSRASFSFHAPYGAGSRGNRIALSYMLNKYPSWVRNWVD